MNVNQYERDREVLAELAAHAEDYARETLLRYGCLSPAIIMDTARGDVMVVANEFSNGIVQDRFGEVATLACISQAASAVVLISECWVKMPAKGEALDMSRPASQYPDRQAMVILKGEARQASNQKLLPTMCSPSGKFIGFGDAYELGSQEMQGRLPQILPDWLPSQEDQEVARKAIYQIVQEAKRARGEERGWAR